MGDRWLDALALLAVTAIAAATARPPRRRRNPR